MDLFGAKARWEVNRLKFQVDEMTERYNKLHEEKTDLENAIRKLRTVHDACQKDHLKTTADLNEARALVREQTAADLLLNALQALGVVPDRDMSKEEHYSRHDALRSQLDAYQQVQDMSGTNIYPGFGRRYAP